MGSLDDNIENIINVGQPPPSLCLSLIVFLALLPLGGTNTVVSQRVSWPVNLNNQFYPGGRSARWAKRRAGARTELGFGWAVSSPTCCRTLPAPAEPLPYKMLQYR